jgi:hypothetical protein
MSLRILSGMIFIPNGGIQQGNVVISFNPFNLANASNAAFELRKRVEIGRAARFVRRPASIIAARQFDIVPLSNDFRVNLSDTVARDTLTISWRAITPRVDQEEIPFMVIGEVPDPVVVRPFRPQPGIVVPQPSDVLRGGRARSRRSSKKKSRSSKKIK